MPSSTRICLLLLLIVFTSSSDARTRCVRVKGRVVCPTDPDRHYNLVVKLLDKDPLPWETDDLLAVAFTDELGNYTVEGCGSDFGQWNDPDPFLLIEHRCPKPGHVVSIPRRYQTIEVEQKYLPDEIHVPTVRIDISSP